MTTTHRQSAVLAAALLTSSLLLTGCGEKVASSQTTPSPAAPVVKGERSSPPGHGSESPLQPTQPGRFGWKAE